MRAAALLIRRYLRKRPGQIVALTLLTAITAALVNLSVILGVSYPASLDETAARTNAADAMYVVPGGRLGALFERTLAADERVRTLEVDDALFAFTTYRLTGEDLATGVVVTRRGGAPTINRPRAVSALGEPVADPIWASQILATSGSYELGDAITFRAGPRERTFRIQGLSEDLYTASPQMGLIGIAVPPSDFPALAAEGLFTRSLAAKVQASSPDEAVAALDHAVLTVQRSGLPGATRFASHWNGHLELIKSGSTLGASIFSVAFLAFAAVIVLVAIIVMRFLIKNLITTDMAAIGTMRAAGFTTTAVIGQLAATFGVTALVASAAGAGLSYLALPGLASALAGQTGISWSPQFSGLALALSVGGLTGSLLVLAIVAAQRVRSVTTVAALRGGIATHSFRRNRLPLDRVAGPVNALLGLKSIPQRASQTAVMALTIAAVTFASVFAIGLTTNLLANPTAFSRMVVGDVEDVGIGVAPRADAAGLVAAVRRTEGVADAFFAAVDGTTIGRRSIAVQVLDDYARLRYDSTYRGRMPRHANEVTVGGKLADQLGLDVGDPWTVRLGGRSARYLVSGLTSSGRAFGLSASFTTAGYRRVDPAFVQDAIAIYVEADADPDAVIARIKAEHGAAISVVANGRKNVDVQLAGYRSMIGALAGIVMAFTIVVIVLVIGLVVATMIAQSRREMGVHKAVGFTTGDLTSQTMWSYLPVVAVGALLGGVLGALGLNPILSAMLRGIGVMKVDLVVAPLAVIALVAAVLVLAALVTWVATRRIGRISAYQLVSE